MGSVGADGPATVWAATWVPSAAPIAGFGAEGYAVAWVDLGTGARIQVLVDGEQPGPGTLGRIEERTIGDTPVSVFVAETQS